MNTVKPSYLPHHIQWTESKTAAQLANELARTIAQQLDTALELQPRASLAVSGGRTPILMLQLLSQQQIDWQRIDVTLADERWVDEHDTASNGALVRTHLIQNHAHSATFYPLYTGAQTASAGQETCQARLNKMHWPLDVLVLGMGSDGHTASLFPQCPSLNDALTAPTPQTCIATLAPVQPCQRITLTAPTLLQAQHTHLHIQGKDKLQVMNQAMQLENVTQMPVFAFLEHPLTIHWCP